MNRNQKFGRPNKGRKLAREEMMSYERALSEVIDSIPMEFKSRIAGEYSRFLLFLKNALPYITGERMKILDVGCGAGIMSLVFRKMGHEVFPIDYWKKIPSTHADYVEAKLNRERLERQGVRTIDLDISEEPLPFEDGSFDVALSLEVIEHLHNSPRKILAETRRVLTDGGILFLSTPNLATLKNRLYVLAGRSNHSEISYYYHSDFFTGHVREYTLNEVKQMLTWEGFDIRRAKFLSDSHILNRQKSRYWKSKVCNTLASSIYLLATTIFPTLRYSIIIVGQKVGANKRLNRHTNVRFVKAWG